MDTPTADRPYMPDYGIADEPTGMLPWSWADARLTRSKNYWLATVRPDGRPHVMPVWGVWADQAFVFSSGPGSRKVRNLLVEPRCAVTTEDPRQPVVLEGVATLVGEPAEVAAYAAAVKAKYGLDMGLDFYVANATVRVLPTWGFALDEEAFQASPTRWTFA